MSVKNLFIVCRFLSLLCVAVMLSACVNTLELAVPRGAERASVTHEGAVADAKAYFDTHFGNSTRSEEQQPTPEAPYVVGNLVPDWESGVMVANEEKSYTDFAIQKDYRFFLALEDEEQRICGFELYSRLASVNDFGLDTLNQFVATYIPDISFLSCYESYKKDNLLTCEYVDWFTGVILYTDLYGYHVAAYKYYDGQLVDSSFLFDKQKSPEENVEDFMRVMGGIALFVASVDEQTRAVATVDIPGGTYVYCYDENTGKIFWEYCEIDSIPIVGASDSVYDSSALLGGNSFITTPPRIVTTIARPSIPLGGGGDSHDVPEGGEEEDEPTGEELAEDLFDTSNLEEPEKAAVADMLEEIYADCMGKVLLDSLTANESNIKYATSYPDNFDIPEELINTSAYIYDQDMLVYRGEGVDVLLHELFHTYQYRMINSEETFEASNAKLEIEAQIARTLFAIRLKDKGEQSCYNALNETRLGFAFVYLTNHYISHTAELQSSVNSKYTELYDYIGTYLCAHLGYNYISGDVSYDYELLTAISENCDDYGKD